MDIFRLAAAVNAGERAPDGETAAALGRLHERESGREPLNAVVHIDPDARQKPGLRHAPVLSGVPLVVKDNIATLTMPTSCGSHLLRNYVSPFEAEAVRRLRDAGAVIIGKSNMDEFGMGSTTEYSAYGPTLNPIDRTRVPGGSSGGSAAAVAAGVVRAALGSETGGSVRQPAAYCGIVGIKPGYGRVSRRGLVAYASSFDQIGVFGATVKEAALVLSVIAGHDALDATSLASPPDTYADLPDEVDTEAGPLAGLTVGLPIEYFPDGLDSLLASRINSVADAFRALGARVREVSLAHTSLAIPAYYVIASAEASSNLSRFDGIRFGVRQEASDVQSLIRKTREAGLGVEVKRRILLGTYALSAGYYDSYYMRAQEARSRIASDFEACFSSGADLLLTPTTPRTAPKLGSLSDPYEMYLSDVFTVTASLAGLPAMSIPVGSANGLPAGAQLIAPRLGEKAMIRVAYVLERFIAGSGATVFS